MTSWTDNFSDSQRVRKPSVRGSGGVAASQHKVASQVGAEILGAGGDAIDAAVAMSFALGVVEPWMSGPLGGGMLTMWRADTGRSVCVEFGMKAPLDLDAKDYPLDTGRDKTQLSAWPAVVDDKNVYGASALGVPGLVAGMDAAHRAWGRMPWCDLLAPAVDIAREGLQLDWFSSSMIAFASRSLAADPDAASMFLSDGHWPNIQGWIDKSGAKLDQGKMADTLGRLAHAGAQDFYEGDIAGEIVADVRAKGGCLTRKDLQDYRAVCREALSFPYRDALLHVPAGLCAGPDLKEALDSVAAAIPATSLAGADLYVALANALVQAQAERLASAGHAAERAPTSTTAFSVVDRHGNIVSVTQTLLSVFGAHTVAPSTGLLMNNAIMWFDPRDGRPNSLAAGADCLMNICPTIGETPAGRFAIGASGGRKILSCVANITAFLVDGRMTLEQAFHEPRIDASGQNMIVTDRSLSAEIPERIEAAGHTVKHARRGPYPYAFGVPAGVFDTGEGQFGCTEVHSPYGDAVAAETR